MPLQKNPQTADHLLWECELLKNKEKTLEIVLWKLAETGQ
jgi:hypothetical protein